MGEFFVLESEMNPVIMPFDVSEDAHYPPNTIEGLGNAYVAIDARNFDKRRKSPSSGQA